MARTVKRWFHLKDGTIEQHEVPADRKVWKLPRELEERKQLLRDGTYASLGLALFDERIFHMVPIINGTNHLWKIFFEQ